MTFCISINSSKGIKPEDMDQYMGLLAKDILKDIVPAFLISR
jgi:hypothetical protein